MLLDDYFYRKSAQYRSDLVKERLVKLIDGTKNAEVSGKEAVSKPLKDIKSHLVNSYKEMEVT